MQGRNGSDGPFPEEIKYSANIVSLKRMNLWARYLVTAVIIIAPLVLIGWQFDIEFFKHPLPNSKSMNPAAAVAFTSASLSFFFLAFAGDSIWKRSTGYFFAVVVLLVGLLKFLSIISVFDFQIDTLLFYNKVKGDRIVPIAAINFMLTGIALLLWKKMHAQYIVLIISLSGLLSLVGYLYNVKTSYGILVYIPMAIHAAICFLFLSIAILFANPGRGIMKELTSSFSGSIVARFLIPAAIIIPVTLGFLRLWAAWAANIPLELGTALQIITNVMIFLLLSWFIIVSLNKRDKLKQEADNAIRENEEQIRTIFNAAPDAVIVIDEQGKIIKWNPQAESLLGWKGEEVLGKLLSETIIPERFREMHKKGLEHFLETGEGPLLGKIVEIYALTKKGAELNIALNIAATPKINNKHLFIGFLRDITEQKKSEQKLKESEEKLRILFNSIDEGFCIIEMIFDEQKKPVDYRFLVINPSFEKQTGLHDAVGKRMREFAPDHEEHWFETYGRIALTGESIRFVNRAEQLHRWYDAYAFRFGEPKNLQVAILFNDITESKLTEELIKKQKQDIQDFIDSMSTLCAKVTTAGKIIIINKTALLATGLSIEELLNTNFLEGKWWTFDADVHSRVRKAFEKACSGVAVTYDENIFVFGKILTINFSLIPIFRDKGEVDYIVAEGRDITELKIIETALTEKTNQLGALNNELEAFSYSVSHDLRAPLRGIIGFSSILEEDYGTVLDDEGKRITSVIKSNTIKMGQLVDDLLAFSRMGRQDIVKTNINTHMMVKEVIEELTSKEKTKDIEWIIHSLPKVNGDINIIRQVWINLISNAMKYSGNKERQRIEIGFSDRGREFIFYVRDNGVGFDEKYKDKLFKVFQRLHSTEEFEGTGVGLALVEKIISKHGGKVWAEGKNNEGACFYFSLPA